MKPATPSDWNTRPLPEERATIELSRRFTTEELAQIQRGVVPDEMEDKWFVYWLDDQLFFHRSWTGICIYVVTFSCDETGATVISADVNRDPDQYASTDDARDAKMISYLIDALLLRRPAPFPTASSSTARAALEQWSEVGRAGLGIHPGDDRHSRARYVLRGREEQMTKPDLESRIRGCILGGAVGDALGAPVEFMGLAQIRSRFGEHGPSDYAEWAGPTGGITDDTQMTLFTAEGVIRGLNRERTHLTPINSERDTHQRDRVAHRIPACADRPRNPRPARRGATYGAERASGLRLT